MSIQLHKAMTNILAMPYYKNEHHQNGNVKFGHELAVERKLLQNSFTQKLYKVKKSVLKDWAESNDDTTLRKSLPFIVPGDYIHQPAGSQDFPDFLIYDFTNRFVGLECKSGEKACPTWNDNLPKPNCLYIYSSLQYNATTIFLGKDVISDQERNLYIEQRQKFLEISNKYKKLQANKDKFNRGWQLVARPKYSQYGGKHKVDYFLHSDKQTCEQNALNFSML